MLKVIGGRVSLCILLVAICFFGYERAIAFEADNTARLKKLAAQRNGAVAARGRLAIGGRKVESGAGYIDAGVLPIDMGDSVIANDMIGKAEHLLNQLRYVDAAIVFQETMDKYGGSTVEKANGRYVDVRRSIERMILDDKKLLDAYRKRFGGEGKHALGLVMEMEEDNLDEGYEDVVKRFRLTEAGLEAGLDLGGLYMSRGYPEGCRVVLDRFENHGDIRKHRGRWVYLRGLAGLYLNEENVAYRDALKGIGGELWVSYKKIAEGLDRPKGVGGVYGVGEGFDETMPSVRSLSKPLWRRGMLISGGGSTRHRINSGNEYVGSNLYPRVWGHRLYLNVGSRIVCFDKISGRQLWDYRLGNIGRNKSSRGMVERGIELSGMGGGGLGSRDRRDVCLFGGRVYAVLGHANGYQASRFMGVPSGPAGPANTRIVCVDGVSGDELWSKSAKQLLGKTGETLEFYGKVHESAGKILVFAKRQDPRTSHVESHIIAVDAVSGEIAWHRYLATLHQDSSMMGTTWYKTIEGGQVFVSDGKTVAGSLNVSDGVSDWLVAIAHLTDLKGEAIRVRRSTSQNDVDAEPLAFKSGIMFPLYSESGSHTAVIMSKTGGEVKRVFTQMEWGASEQVVKVEGGFLVLGARIAYYGDDWKRRWTYKLGEKFSRFRPVVSKGVIYVCCDENTLKGFNLADGKQVLKQRIVESGNLMLAGEQLLVAGNYQLASYMSFGKAYGYLRGQMLAHDTDPAYGISLGEMAILAGKFKYVIEGIDGAIKSLAMGDKRGRDNSVSQRRVFDAVLGMLDSGKISDLKVREQLFGRLKGIGRGANDRVVYLLRHSAMLEGLGRVNAAVDAYQTIFDVENLADEIYREGGRSKDAGLVARLRLDQLIKKHGAEIYDRYRVRGESELAALLAKGDGEVSAFLRLGEKYPLTMVGPKALVQAGRLYAKAGDALAASIELSRAYRVMSRMAEVDEKFVGDVVGQLVYLYETDKRYVRGLSWLRKLKRHYGVMMLTRGKEVIESDRWGAELAKLNRGTGRVASVGLPLNDFKVLDGRYLEVVSKGEENSRGDLMILMDGDVLRCYSSYEHKILWERELVGVDGDRVELLSVNATEVLVWDRYSGRVFSYAIGTGKELWKSGEMSHVMGKMLSASTKDTRGQRQMENQRDLQKINELRVEAGFAGFDQIRNAGRAINKEKELSTGLPEGTKYFCRLNDMVVCLVDPRGYGVGLDRRTGKVLWQQSFDVEMVHGVEIGFDGVAVLGSVIDTSDAAKAAVKPRTKQARVGNIQIIQGGFGGMARNRGRVNTQAKISRLSRIEVLDPMSGESRMERIEEPGLVGWMSLGVDGHLVYQQMSDGKNTSKLSKRLVSVEIQNGGGRREIDLGKRLIRGDKGWVFDELIMFASKELNNILVYDWAKGVLVEQVSFEAFGDGIDDLRVKRFGSELMLQTDEDVACFGFDGKMRWRDRGGDYNRQYRDVCVSGDKVFVLDLIAPDLNRMGADVYKDDLLIYRPLGGADVKSWRYQIHCLELGNGRVVERYDLGVMKDWHLVGKFKAVDGGVVLGTSSRSILFRGAAVESRKE